MKEFKPIRMVVIDVFVNRALGYMFFMFWGSYRLYPSRKSQKLAAKCMFATSVSGYWMIMMKISMQLISVILLTLDVNLTDFYQ